MWISDAEIFWMLWFTQADTLYKSVEPQNLIAASECCICIVPMESLVEGKSTVGEDVQAAGNRLST